MRAAQDREGGFPEKEALPCQGGREVRRMGAKKKSLDFMLLDNFIL